MGAMKRRPKMLQTVTLLTRIAASPPLVTSKVALCLMWLRRRVRRREIGREIGRDGWMDGGREGASERKIEESRGGEKGEERGA